MEEVLFVVPIFVFLSGTFPLDTTKTRLQVQGQKLDIKHAHLKYSGMTNALLQISKEEGFRALYSGYVFVINILFKL